MAAFSIVAFGEPAALRQAVEQQYGTNFFEFSPSTWFVADAGTTKNVADRLGLTGGQLGAQGVVLRLDAYSGWGPAAGWTWLGRFPEAVPNG